MGVYYGICYCNSSCISCNLLCFVRGDSSSSTSTTTPSSNATEVVADVNNNGITSKDELKTLTKVQLFDFAEKQNLKVKKSGTKEKVINEIHSQLR